MDAHHVSIEEIEEYYMVVSQTFPNEEQGFEFYNRYAKAKGFSVRKADQLQQSYSFYNLHFQIHARNRAEQQKDC